MDSSNSSNGSKSRRHSMSVVSDLSYVTGAVIVSLVICYYFYYLSDSFMEWSSWLISSSRELRTDYPPGLIQRYLNVLRSSTGNGSFATQMRSFPWDGFKSAVNSKDPHGIQLYYAALVTALVPFVVREPIIPINNSCEPPPLTFPPIHSCRKLSKPRKVGVLINFSFDVDALEIHLQELDAVVDKFFLLEANQPHNFYVSSKPSIWDLVKFTPRFYPFLSKVVHFVVDDANSVKTDQLINVKDTPDEDKDWLRENLAIRLRWEKFLEWNNGAKYFELDDLLGFGDTDEIPDRNNIYFLKHCEFPAEEFPVDIGVWYPLPFLDRPGKPDHSIRGHPFVLGDPTYWTLWSAMSYGEKSKKAPDRNRGKSPGYMLGGIHLSKYGYMPFSMIKQLAATPTFMKGFMDCIDIGMMYRERGSQIKDSDVDKEVMHFDRKKNLENSMSMAEFKARAGTREVDAIMKIPWFIKCNRGRYPALDDKYDLRLDGLFRPGSTST